MITYDTDHIASLIREHTGADEANALAAAQCILRMVVLPRGIAYDIEPHEITALTEPMWQACGLECPVMIGGTCGRDRGEMCTLPKHNTAAAEVVYGWTLESSQDEECGNAIEGPAWHALFRAPEDEQHYDNPMGAGVILSVGMSGATYAYRYETSDALKEAWEDCLVESGESDDDDDGES